MQVSSSLAATFRPSAEAAFALIGRLAQTLPVQTTQAAPRPAASTLTPLMVRAALLEMGLGAAEPDVALAAALVQIGLPLTAASLGEANAALARAPGAVPEAYVLAVSLALPTSPASLKALTTVLAAPVNGLPPAAMLPDQVRTWLGFSLEADTPSETLARSLGERMRQTGRSAEHRLVSALLEGASRPSVLDARTVLLRLAQSSGDRALGNVADTLASHLEGQQLLNQASLQAHANRPEVPLYLAVPLVFGTHSSLAEVRFWARTSMPEEGEREDAETTQLRITVRVAPPRLGRVQADLAGRVTGSLSCRLGVEQASAQRLLARNTGALAEALSEAGWGSCDVTCGSQSHWPPLWHGGDALTTPRTCVDRHV